MRRFFYYFINFFCITIKTFIDLVVLYVANKKASNYFIADFFNNIDN